VITGLYLSFFVRGTPRNESCRWVDKIREQSQNSNKICATLRLAPVPSRPPRVRYMLQPAHLKSSTDFFFFTKDQHRCALRPHNLHYKYLISTNQTRVRRAINVFSDSKPNRSGRSTCPRLRRPCTGRRKPICP